MVLPAPAAAEGQAAQAWLTRVRQWLTLGHAGTMIVVRYVHPWSPWPVLERIAAMGEKAETFVDARRIGEAAPDSILVVLLRRVDLDWLNVNRPQLAGRRVVVWVPAERWLEYREGAPDLFDWASHTIDAPPILPKFVAEGFEVARGWWPGIVWLGGAPLELILQLLAEAGKWPMAGGEIAWVDTNQSQEDLTARFEEHRGDVVVVRGVRTFHDRDRIYGAMYGRAMLRVVILEMPSISTLGWYPLHGRQLPIDDWNLQDTSFEGEPEAVEMEEPLHESILSKEDVQYDVWLLRHPGPLMRLFHNHASVVQQRQAMRHWPNTPAQLWNTPLDIVTQIFEFAANVTGRNIPGASSLTRGLQMMSSSQDPGRTLSVARMLALSADPNTRHLVVLAVARWLGPDEALALLRPTAPHTHAAAVERAMLHLHEGQLEPAMDLLRPYLDDIHDPPRAQQLWILALRMQGRAVEATEQIEAWVARGLDPEFFELRGENHGTPREWLEQTMAADFDAVLNAALAAAEPRPAPGS